MNEQEQEDLAQAEEVCRKFLAWDLDAQQQGDGYASIKDGLSAVPGRCDAV